MERSAVKFGMPVLRSGKCLMAIADCYYPHAFVKMGWFIVYFSLYNPALMERSAVNFGMPTCREVW